ncbi:hypothetical protein CsSME_00023602 [Camellia sinensis var. sinensis]
MATSAFKSTSRRGNTTTSSTSSSRNSPKKAPIRRSLSVSALSRTHDHLQSDITSEFLNKRDNPLFWSCSGPPDKEIEPQDVRKVSATVLTGSVDGQRERGRSVTRNSSKKVGEGGRKPVGVGGGRSLSKVDTGRRGRSVSTGHYAASESEVEQDSVVSSYRNKSSSTVAANGLKKANLGRNVADMRIKYTEHPVVEPSHNSNSNSQTPNWEDGISTGSFLEAEEKTIKAVCEQMKSFQGDIMGGGDTTASGIYETVRSEVRRAISDIQNDLECAIQRNNGTAIATTNIADIAPDLVNPGAIELVLDIRREYARKLEESGERARKLRADLTVEEHRGEELSRILKELLPDPKTINMQKSRPGRKSSSERKKMSRRLTEEAMAYFDECVSISTFDSSDFSAPEDPPLNLIGATTPVGGTASLAQESGGHGQLIHSNTNSSFTTSSGSNEINQASLRGNNAESGRKLQFSFSRKPTESVGLQQDIRNYIKKNEKEFEKDDIDSENFRSNYYDLDEYNLQGRAESLLFDRVLFKNRIESGCLHLCDGVVMNVEIEIGLDQLSDDNIIFLVYAALSIGDNIREIRVWRWWGRGGEERKSREESKGLKVKLV